MLPETNHPASPTPSSRFLSPRKPVFSSLIVWVPQLWEDGPTALKQATAAGQEAQTLLDPSRCRHGPTPLSPARNTGLHSLKYAPSASSAPSL